MAPRSCYLRAFADSECSGRLQRAHLIKQQTLRRELKLAKPKKGGRPAQVAAWLIVWDSRCWVWACLHHHRLLDDSRKLRIPRARLPAELEDFARQHGLSWWLCREYGCTPACAHT